MGRRRDIFGVGTAAVDDLLFLEKFPLPDSKMPVTEMRRHCGGQTAVALITAARHGAKAAFCAQLGRDPLSRFVVRTLEKEGVDCSPLAQSPGGGPIYSVILVVPSTGSRTILYSSSRMEEPDPEEIRPEWISDSRCVFFDQNAPRAGLRTARLANESGIPVAADLEKMNIPGLEELLARIDHLIISLDFAKMLTGLEDVIEILDRLSPSRRIIIPRPWDYPAATVITAGALGCWYRERSGAAAHFPAYPVQAVDTTGCGDVFHGAYSAAVARGEPVPQAVAIASATAAIKATSPDGPDGIPSLAAARAFAAKREDG